MPIVADILSMSKGFSEELYLELAEEWGPKLFFWAKQQDNLPLKAVGMKAWTDAVDAR